MHLINATNTYYYIYMALAKCTQKPLVQSDELDYFNNIDYPKPPKIQKFIYHGNRFKP